MKRRFFVTANLDSKDAKIPKILDRKCVNKTRKCLEQKSSIFEPSVDLDENENKVNLESNYGNSDFENLTTTPHLSPIRKCSSIYEIINDESSLDSISSEEVIKTLTNSKKFVSTYSLIKNNDYNENSYPEQLSENVSVTNVACSSSLDKLQPFVMTPKIEKNSSKQIIDKSDYYYFKNKTCNII